MAHRQKWEASENMAVREAWQKVWEYVRAMRISGVGEDWAYTDDAYLVASQFAEDILGEEQAYEFTDEYADLIDQCIEEMASLL